MMLIAERAWPRRVVLLLAGFVAGGLSDFSWMGYYGLLVPQTALAKDASGQQMGPGRGLPAQLHRPHALWIPMVLLIALTIVPTADRLPDRGARRAVGRRPVGFAARAQSPAAVVVFMLVSGLLQGLYWIRQGGDFMHRRVLLARCSAC